jgi:hypothetical protein
MTGPLPASSTPAKRGAISSATHPMFDIDLRRAFLKLSSWALNLMEILAFLRLVI